MADNNNLQALYNGFRRLKDFPLDPSCIFETKDELDAYVGAKSTAYPGQVIVILEKENRGLYFLKNKDNEEEVGLAYSKAIDDTDFAKIEEDFAELASLFDNFKEETGQNLDTMYERVQDEFVTLDEFKKITGLDATEVQGAVDTLKEVFIILEDINNAIVHSPAFKIINSEINKLKKLVPFVNFGAGTDAEFQPHPDQILVTTGELNDVKNFVAHSEKATSFKFGDNFSCESEELGGDNGYTITEIRVVIENPTNDSITGQFIGNSYAFIKVSHSHDILVPMSDIDFSEAATFIYTIEHKITQKSSVNCWDVDNNKINFHGASGTIYIKYFE